MTDEIVSNDCRDWGKHGRKLAAKLLEVVRNTKPPVTEVISFIESTPPEPGQEPPPASSWTRRQWDEIQQLKARTLHAESKMQEHIDKSQKRQRGKY